MPSSGAGLRSGRDRDAQRRPGQGRTPGQRVRGTARAHLRGRRQLHRTRRPMLLRFHGNRAGGRPRVRPSAHRAHDDDGRRYMVDVGSDDGADMLAALPLARPREGEIDSARSRCRRGRAPHGPSMPAGDLRELLIESRESPHWDEVASRCLTCGNCTMACPTCFCTSVEDVTDLTGEHAERWMNWASCFEFDFTFVHEGSVRQTGPSRYRHWITHKLGTWHDQFGSSGCVGCGRCIAWCPTGIDITEEMNTLAGLAEQSDD